jgi:hypothetical protein
MPQDKRLSWDVYTESIMSSTTEVGLAALVGGLIIATISYNQPALDKAAFQQRAQDAAAHGQKVYVEFGSPDQPAQKQADRLDGMIYGFGVALVGVLLFAASRLQPVVPRA